MLIKHLKEKNKNFSGEDMNIAIVDDDKNDCSLLKEQIERCSLKIGAEINIACFSSGVSFLDKYVSYDVVFMDIDMDFMNGISVGKELRKIDTNVIIVFVTNFPGYALSGYSVQAYDFLIKPVSYPILSALMDKLVSITEKRKKEKIIRVKNKESFFNIPASQVYYVEIVGRKRIWRTTEGELYDFGLISDLEKELAPYDFIRCHVSFLVNLKYVKKIQGNYVWVKNEKLLISRGKRKEFMDALTEYIGKTRG